MGGFLAALVAPVRIVVLGREVGLLEIFSFQGAAWHTLHLNPPMRRRLLIIMLLILPHRRLLLHNRHHLMRRAAFTGYRFSCVG